MPEQQTLSDTITKDKMNKIIACIIKGKYSSACLMLLEATGYNPLHYIPYSTYHRLQKQYLQSNQKRTGIKEGTGSLTYKSTVSKNLAPENLASNDAASRLKVSDLDYIEPISAEALSVSGGMGYRGAIAASWHSRKLQTSPKVEQTLKMETFEKETSLYFKYQLRG